MTAPLPADSDGLDAILETGWIKSKLYSVKSDATLWQAEVTMELTATALAKLQAIIAEKERVAIQKKLKEWADKTNQEYSWSEVDNWIFAFGDYARNEYIKLEQLKDTADGRGELESEPKITFDNSALNEEIVLKTWGQHIDRGPGFTHFKGDACDSKNSPKAADATVLTADSSVAELREAIRTIWRPLLDKSAHAQEMAYLITTATDETEALFSQHTARAVREARIAEALKEANAALKVAKSGDDMLMVKYLKQRVESLKASYNKEISNE